MSGQHPFKSKAEFEAFKNVYATLKDRLPTTVWIFESGDFLILSHPDSKHAEDCLPPNNLRSYDVESGGCNASLTSVLAAKCYQRLLQQILLVLHYRVEIYRFQNGLYSVAINGSPCDLSEIRDLMFDQGEAYSDGGYSEKMLTIGPLCAVVLEGDPKSPHVGICFWHEASKTVKMAEFFDNTGHDKLESILVQRSPMEAVIANQPKYRTVRKILERNKILPTYFVSKKTGAAATKSDSAIEKILKDANAADRKVAAKAFATLNQHVNVNLVEAIQGKGIELINTDDFVHLNLQAVSGLNIFDVSGQAMSLFKVLNKTRTSGGERLLRVWLRQPLTDKLKIEERLSLVEAFVCDSGARKMIHDNYLRRIPDLESLSVKLEEKKNSLQDLYKCYQGAKEVTKLTEYMSGMGLKLVNDTFVGPLTKRLEKLRMYIELVEATLDMEAISNEGVFELKATFDDELMHLSEKKSKLKGEMESSAADIARTVGLDAKSIKLEFTNQHGYTYRVTMKDEKTLRKKQSSIMIVDTNKSGVRFRDRALDQLNKSFLSVNSDFDERQRYVMKEISEITCGYATIFSNVGELISHLDCLVGFAVTAVIAPVPYSKPKIVSREEGLIKLVDARHPCLELLDNIAFIPNSIEFSNDKNFCIITGPNLGGKSTFLRTVALNILMAQVGSFVASSEAVVFPIDKVLVRIGAGDCQLQGVSTFMAEMLEAAHIVRASTRNSLILIDELGRGTSTYDGLGISWAISEHIASQIRAPTLFATHFHEVTRLADILPDSVFNCYVDAVTSDDQFTLLYQVRNGSSNKSFGLEVARLAGFPSDVIADAKSFLETAEMPILRNSKALESSEVASFVSAYKSCGNDKKRQLELLTEMKAKVQKLAN